MDSVELIVGVEDGGGGLAVCDRAMRRCTAADTAALAEGSGSGSADERRVKRESKRS